MNFIKEIAIIAIAALTGYMLFLGHNGLIFATIIGVIATMAGYEVGVKKKGK